MRSMNSTFKWKQFSPISRNFLAKSNHWLNFAVGSVRSGKTITVLTRFIEFVVTSPNEDFMMIGKTLNTLERNVVRPFIKMVSAMGVPVEHNKYMNEVYFLDKTICLFGVGKKGDDEKIQGSTFAGTLIDEGTVIPEEGFKMILSRNSLDGAKIFITCNPANPNHYLYMEYIANKEMINDGKCKVWTFNLEDNLTLSDEYVENLKASYPRDSLFYKRYILGQWVSGQGAIYSRFDDNNIYSEDRPLSYYDYLEFGSDYGAGSTTCWNLVGVKYFEDHIEYDIIDEGGHNAEDEGYSLTDSEIVDLICDMQDYYHLDLSSTFYPSHDAKSLKTELEKNERVRMHIQTFTPDTLECIGEISSLFYKNYIRVHERCRRTIDCIRGYEWDVNMARKGKDVPHKVDDHFCDSIRAPIINHLYTDSGIGGYIDW